MYQQIPQGLQALMVLQQEATPMGPAGPTVANQLMQRVQQPPMQPPPGGQPGMRPGMQQMAPRMMPGTPNQGQPGMMQTLQAQSQQSAQQQPPGPPQQPPGPPQGMAHGGLASLRADNIARMKYAQGGVIGFANQGYVDPLGMGTAAPGEETSDTPGKKDKELLRALISMGMLPAAALDLLQAPAAAVAKTSLPGVDPNKFSYTPAVSALRNALANIDKPEVAQAAPEAPVAPTDVGRPAEALTPQQIEQAMRSASIAGAGAKPGSSPGGTGSGRTPGPAAASAQAPRPMQGPTAAPSVQSMFDLAKANVGVDPTIAQMEALGEERRKLQAARPDIEGMGIAALKQAEEERKALLEQQRGGDFLRRISALAGDFANRFAGDKLNTLDAVIAKRDQESIEAAKASQMAQLKMMDLAHANKIGDIDAAIKLKKDITDLNEKRMGHMINAANLSQHLTGQVYSSQTSFLSQRAHDASQERMNSQRLAAQVQEMGQNKLATQLNAANLRVQTAETAIAETLKKEFPLSITWRNDPASAVKDPSYQGFVERERQLKNEILIPAMRTRDYLSRKVMGDESNEDYFDADRIAKVVNKASTGGR